jgi:hypothetical protein
MKRLSKEINRNGFQYFLLKRTPKKALYRQTLGNVQVGFEVFLIRVHGKQFSPLLNKSFDAAERFPGNEDFGRTAWSFMDYQKALKKYMEL